MKSIKTSSIPKVLAILLVIGTFATQKDAIQNHMSVWGGGINSATTERIATVDIVYPRIPGTGTDCTTDRTDIRNFIIEKDTQLCAMNSTQVNSLVNRTGYDKELFCNCITEFCGTNPQPEEFVNCLKKPEQL